MQKGAVPVASPFAGDTRPAARMRRRTSSPGRCHGHQRDGQPGLYPGSRFQMAGGLLETYLRQLIAGATGAGKTGRMRTWQHRERAEVEDAGAAGNDGCAG